MLRWTLAAAVLALSLVGRAEAVYPPAVKDDGRFFTKEGAERANKKIREIYEKYKKDVVVETLPGFTSDQEKKVKEDGADKFMARLANDRAKEVGLNGVYILMVKKPAKLRLHMDADTQKRAFTASNRTAAIGKIVAQAKEDNFDAALFDGLFEIESALRANSGEAPKKSPK